MKLRIIKNLALKIITRNVKNYIEARHVPPRQLNFELRRCSRVKKRAI